MELKPLFILNSPLFEAGIKAKIFSMVICPVVAFHSHCLSMKTFIFSFLVLLITCVSCCKDEPNESPKFEYIENFEDTITYHNWKLVTNYHNLFEKYSGSTALYIEVVYCNCNNSYGSATNNFTNFEGEKIFNLSGTTTNEGKITLQQLRNGNIIRSDSVINIDYDYRTVSLLDTFIAKKSDTFQIILSYRYNGAISGPSGCYFDNIELIER
jgi:hypothetical protein